MADRLLTPQQELFLSHYTNPKSETFSNALQSALKAGYSQEYAENITSLLPDWLSESIGDMKRLRKAEKNLDEVQNLSIHNEEGKPDPQLIDKRTKVDMFIAERLNKPKYSTKVDIEHKGTIENNITDELIENIANKINAIHKGANIQSNGIVSDTLGS